MNEFVLQSGIYQTGKNQGILPLLEKLWIKNERNPTTLHVVSCFGTFNGGVRFFPHFAKHIEGGGSIKAIFAGDTRQNLTSRQLGAEMVKIGANVSVVDSRSALFHTKCYGSTCVSGDELIVSSANFTGRGLANNIESSVYLDVDLTHSMGFSWRKYHQQLLENLSPVHELKVGDAEDVWNLLYDEARSGKRRLERGVERQAASEAEFELKTMVITLSHADAARMNAPEGSNAARGSQYFWLSKDCYDFFPPLTIPNERGEKRTYSCIVRLCFIDLGSETHDIRVTYEAENNLDFRLGTGPLRFSGLASKGDMAAITRIGFNDYQLRLFVKGSPNFAILSPFATERIGHQGKVYGYLSNDRFEQLLKIELPASS